MKGKNDRQCVQPVIFSLSWTAQRTLSSSLSDAATTQMHLNRLLETKSVFIIHYPSSEDLVLQINTIWQHCVKRKALAWHHCSCYSVFTVHGINRGL